MSNLKQCIERTERTEEMAAGLQAQLDFLQSRLKLLENRQPKGSNKGNTRITSKTSSLSADEIEDLLLEYIDEQKSADSREFGLKYSLNPNQVYGGISSLEASEYIIKEQKSVSFIVLTKEAKQIIEIGSPEYRLFNAITQGTNITKDELQSKFDKNTFTVGFKNCMKDKWLIMNKSDKTLSRNPNINESNIIDNVANILRQINIKGVDSVKSDVISQLKKRKLVKNENVKYYILTPGVKFSRTRVKPIAKVTADDVKQYLDSDTGEWRGPPLKDYNFNALGQKPDIGSLHPLMRMRHEMRNILLEMGFEEMPTNQYVESSFMNFDTLFQPQQHPARDAHDTFFLKKPALADIPLRDYMERVKRVHREGGYGSIGWRYDWQESEARKNLLRTHTTAVSSRMLYKLAQLKPFRPKKYFSIDRVFRNEAIDHTHLAEFHQVEGFVADYDLTLGHLIGVIGEFFKKIGIPDVKFKPAYNPYTEPSMEIFGWSEERNKYVEVGNSGIFRPEMLETMGLPKDVKVIAWGLGLERPCMIATKVGDIRELFGPKVKVSMVKEFPFTRYDKSNKQNNKNKNNSKQ